MRDCCDMRNKHRSLLCVIVVIHIIIYVANDIRFTFVYWNDASAKRWLDMNISKKTKPIRFNPSGADHGIVYYRADSRFAPDQWETALLCNDVSHWLGARLESALCDIPVYTIIDDNIRSHLVDYVGFYLSRRRNSTHHTVYFFRNDKECKYISLFSLISYVGQEFSQWSQVTHICVRKLTDSGSDDDLSPSR